MSATMNTMTDLNNRTLGELIGLTHSGASRLLSGVRTPSVDTMKRISVAFGIPLGEVVEAATQSDDPAVRADRWGRYFRARVVGLDLDAARDRVKQHEQITAVPA